MTRSLIEQQEGYRRMLHTVEGQLRAAERTAPPDRLLIARLSTERAEIIRRIDDLQAAIRAEQSRR